MDVLRVAIAMAMGIVLPLGLQLWDRRRRGLMSLSRASGTVSRRIAIRRAGPWTWATWGAALYAFGPLSMLGWCWLTRPRWVRCFVGPLMMWLAVSVMVLIDMALAPLGLGPDMEPAPNGGSASASTSPTFVGAIGESLVLLVAAAALCVLFEVVGAIRRMLLHAGRRDRPRR